MCARSFSLSRCFFNISIEDVWYQWQFHSKLAKNSQPTQTPTDKRATGIWLVVRVLLFASYIHFSNEHR